MPLNKAEQEALRTSAALPDEVFEMLRANASEVTVKRSTVGGQVVTKVRARVSDKVAMEIADLMPANTEIILEGRQTVGIEIITQSVLGEGQRPFFVDSPRPKNYGRPISFMTRCAAALRMYGWVSKTEADSSNSAATYVRAMDPTLATLPEDESLARSALDYWMSSETVSSPREKRIKQAVLQDVVVESTAPFCAVAVSWIWRRYRTGQQIDDFVSWRAARADLCRRAGCPERRTVGAYCAEHAAAPVDLEAVFGNIGKAQTAFPPTPKPARNQPANTSKKEPRRVVERTATMQVTAKRRVVLKPKGS